MSALITTYITEVVSNITCHLSISAEEYKKSSEIVIWNGVSTI